MKRSNTKRNATSEVQRQKSELERIEASLRSALRGIETLRELLAQQTRVSGTQAPPKSRTRTGEESIATKTDPRIGRLRTAKGSLKQAVFYEIQSLDPITSSAVHERLVAKGFEFSTDRSVASVRAWLRKFTEQGLLVQTSFGKGTHPVQFRKMT